MVASVGNDYTDRFIQAMKDAGRDPDNSKDVRWLAGALGISYNAVKKVIAGGTGMLAADNNVKAARALGVCSEWLATGERSSIARSADAAEIAAIFDSTSDMGRVVLRATAHALIVEPKPIPITDEPEPPPAAPTPARKIARKRPGA